jgi:hypothetical protein
MTHPSGAIAPWLRSMTVPRGDVRLPVCWVRAPWARAEAGARRDVLSPLELSPFLPLQANVRNASLDGDSLAFILGPKPPPDAIEAMLFAADRGARVYVLAGPGFGEGQRDVGLRERAQARVLVRTLSGLPVSAILSGRGVRAGVWLGRAPDEAPSFWLPLSAAQGEALFQTFLHLFWHEAQEEAWTGSGPLVFQKVPPRPFDVPLPGPRAPVRLEDPKAPALSGVPGDACYLPLSATLPDSASRPAVLFTPARAAGQDALAALARAGTRVVWQDLGLPAFRVGAAAGAMECASASLRLRISLEPEQAAALHRLAVHAAQHAAFQLGAGIALSEIQGDAWLPGRPSPEPLITSVDCPTKPVDAIELRAVTTTDTTSRPEPPPLALAVVYRWKVLPPRVPSGVKPADLVDAWNKLDADVEKQIGAARARLVDLEAKEGALGRKFTALAGALLGFGRTRAELRRTVDELSGAPPSRLGPEGARGLLRRLVDAEAGVARLAGEVIEEGRKASEAAERDQQQRAWEEEKQRARQALAACRAELTQAEQRRDEAYQELATLTEGGDAVAQKDRKARRSKLEDDAARLSTRIREVEARIEGHEKALAAAFVFRASSAPGAGSAPARIDGPRFVPGPPPRPPEQAVPGDALPEVGQLVQREGIRYLIITQWEELDRGEACAQRLSARLVAPMEAP